MADHRKDVGWTVVNYGRGRRKHQDINPPLVSYELYNRRYNQQYRNQRSYASVTRLHVT